MNERCCQHCGAPVGADGRYEAEEPLRTSAVDNNRNARHPLAAEVERLRAATGGRAAIGSPSWWTQRTGHQHGKVCVICGGELPKLATRGYRDHPRKVVASHRLFCSNKCRQKAYRITKKVRAENGGGWFERVTKENEGAES